MRKLYYFVVFALFLPLVSAQAPIAIENNPISIFLIIPGIIILLLLIVLLVATFKQQMTLFFIKAMSFKRLFNRIRSKGEVRKIEAGKEESVGISHEAFDNYMMKLSSIEKQMSSSSADDSFKSFSSVAKDFFANVVGANHAYTDEEIALHLEKKRKTLLEFSEKLSQMKYSGYKPSDEELVQLMNQFKSMVSAQVKHEKGSAKMQVSSSNLIAKIVDEDKKIFDSIKEYVDYLRHEDKKEQILDMLVDQQKVLKHNIGKAKRAYDDILKLYVQLSPEERKRLYPDLVQFYNNVNSMLFSSLYSKKSKEELAYFTKELEKLSEITQSPSALKHLVKIPASLPKVKTEPAKKSEVSKRQEIAKSHSGAFEIKLRIPRWSFPRFSIPKLKIPDVSVPGIKPQAHKERQVMAPKRDMPEPPRPERQEPIELPELKLTGLPHKPVEQVNNPLIMGMFKKMPLLQQQVGAQKGELSKDERGDILRSSVKIEQPKVAGIKEYAFPKGRAIQVPVLPKVQMQADLRPKMISDRVKVQQDLQDLQKIKYAIKEKQVVKPKPTVLQSEEEKIIGKINKMMEIVPGEIEQIDNFAEIRKVIVRAESQLAQKDYSTAEITYECIKPLFVALSERDKKIVYPELFDFNRKLAAALAVRKIMKDSVKVKPNEALLDEEQMLIQKIDQLKSSIS